MRRLELFPQRIALGVLAAMTLAPGLAPAAENDPLPLTLRRRVESPGLGGACRVVEKAVTWDPKHTAAIVCDMWDLHHCLNAVRRETDMAPRMNLLLKELRPGGHNHPRP